MYSVVNNSLIQSSFEHLIPIVNQFQITGSIRTITLIGSGHINESYLVITNLPGTNYVLQKINHGIFKDIPALMENIVLVCQHIERKVKANDPSAQGFIPLTVIPSITGQNWLQDDSGCFWRLYNHVPETTSYDLITDPALAY